MSLTEKLGLNKTYRENLTSKYYEFENNETFTQVRISNHLPNVIRLHVNDEFEINNLILVFEESEITEQELFSLESELSEFDNIEMVIINEESDIDYAKMLIDRI